MHDIEAKERDLYLDRAWRKEAWEQRLHPAVELEKIRKLYATKFRRAMITKFGALRPLLHQF